MAAILFICVEDLGKTGPNKMVKLFHPDCQDLKSEVKPGSADCAP